MASNKKTFNIHFSTNNPSNNDHYQHNNQKEDDYKTFMKKRKEQVNTYHLQLYQASSFCQQRLFHSFCCGVLHRFHK